MDAKERALANLTAAVEKASDVAQEHQAGGASPEVVGARLAQLSDGLSPEARIAYLGAVVANMDGEQSQAAATAALHALEGKDKVAAISTATDGMSDEELEELERVLATRRSRNAGTPPANPPN